MTDYTQLTDDELRRKVLELMGYSVESRVTLGIINYVLCKNGNALEESGLLSRDNCWKYAPDPLTDANVRETIEKELLDMGYWISTWQDGETVNVHLFGNKQGLRFLADYRPSIGRAICEVYCQVKEQK